VRPSRATLLLPGVALLVAAVTIGTQPVTQSAREPGRATEVPTTITVEPAAAEVLGTSISRDELARQVADLRAKIVWLEAVIAARDAASTRHGH
jgi:hypothetical protein